MIPQHPRGPANCPSASPSGQFLCTRVKGHPGSHMGNGVGELMGIWDDEFEFSAHTGEWS